MVRRRHEIRVTNEHREQLIVYEIRCNPSLFGLIAERRFELCSGEQLVAVETEPS